MIKRALKGASLLLAAGLLFTACEKNKNEEPQPTTVEKYVIMTMSERTPTKPGYVTAFDEFNGTSVSNIVSGKSLQGLGMGGWRPYKNWLFKMFNTAGNEKGIERIDVAKDGTVSVGPYLKTGNGTNGSGNFVIAADDKGFYWDAEKPWEIQVFNPATVARVSTLGNYEEDLKRDDEGILFQAIGQHFLAIKNGKLFADITYSKTEGAQAGMFGSDFFEDVYIAVIDVATGNYEKTITIDDTGGIAYVNENPMYAFDTNGDLYIVCQGRTVTGGKSKIVRIKAAATDIDPDWVLDIDEINSPIKGKFVSVFAKNGKLVTLMPNAELSAQNINTQDVWDYYSVDVASKAFTKITGVPSLTNPGAAFGTVEVDGKILLRVTAISGENGYYELNGTAATPWITITEGGSMSGIHKIELE